MPGAAWSSRPDAGPDKRSYRVSFEKIARMLPEFKPQWDVRKGAEQLYAAYRASGLTLEEFEGRYQRISHIKALMREGIARRRPAPPGPRSGAETRRRSPRSRERYRSGWGGAVMDRLLDDAGVGEEIFALAAEIYPICRSITGDGVRNTLDHLLRHIALEVYEVPTGTQVFDWTIPREWTDPRRLHQECGRRASCRFPQLQPARTELQPAGPCDPAA